MQEGGDTYVDIHAHVLPGIDDGPEDLESTLEMTREAAGAGTHTLASTPHLRRDFPDVHVHELADRCQQLRRQLDQESIDLELVCGAEVSLVWAVEAEDEDLRLASYGQRGGDLLIETPDLGAAALPSLLYELRARGFRITLAHPERSREFIGDPELLSELVGQGVLLQVNADTLISQRGSPVRRLAERLCRDGLVHALASDGHRARSWRPVTSLDAGVQAAAALVGPERARWMGRDAPAAILNGAELPDPPPITGPRRRSRLFGRR